MSSVISLTDMSAYSHLYSVLQIPKMEFVIQEQSKRVFTFRHLPVAKAHLASRFL